MRILVFLLFSTTVLLAKDNKYSIDRLNWEKQITPMTRLKIENNFGNVIIKKAYNDTFIIHAVTQNHLSRENKAQFIINENNNEISIKLAFDNNKILFKERSDLTLIIPKDIQLDLQMDAGKLQAKKIINPIKLNVNSTNIEITTKSQFDIFSKTGDISIKLLSEAIPQNSKIQSYKGNIELKYIDDNPYFNVISGNPVVSNSAQLLSSKILKKRNAFFNNEAAPIKIKIINDIGHVILIKKTNI